MAGWPCLLILVFILNLNIPEFRRRVRVPTREAALVRNVLFIIIKRTSNTKITNISVPSADWNLAAMCEPPCRYARRYTSCTYCRLAYLKPGSFIYSTYLVLTNRCMFLDLLLKSGTGFVVGILSLSFSIKKKESSNQKHGKSIQI